MRANLPPSLHLYTGQRTGGFSSETKSANFGIGSSGRSVPSYTSNIETQFRARPELGRQRQRRRNREFTQVLRWLAIYKARRCACFNKPFEVPANCIGSSPAKTEVACALSVSDAALGFGSLISNQCLSAKWAVLPSDRFSDAFALHSRLFDTPR